MVNKKTKPVDDVCDACGAEMLDQEEHQKNCIKRQQRYVSLQELAAISSGGDADSGTEDRAFIDKKEKTLGKRGIKSSNSAVKYLYKVA